MLFVLIPLSIAVTGLVLAGRIVYRKIPRDMDLFNKEVSNENFGPAFYEKAISQFSFKAKEAAIKTSTRLVYRLKITSLKTENFFGRLLQEMKSHKENMKPAITDSSSDDMSQSSKVEEERIPEKEIDFKVSSVVSDSQDFNREIIQNYNEVEKIEEKPKSEFEIKENQLINQLAYNPKDVSAYKRLGWLYIENNKPIQARQSFKMAVKLGSKDRILMAKLLEIGGVLHKEGNIHNVKEEPVVASVSIKSKPTKRKEIKESKPKSKKIKIRKI